MAICENCEQEHDGSYGSGRFCNAKCARGFSTKAKRKEINEKVSKKLTKNVKKIIITDPVLLYCNRYKKTFTEIHYIKCEQCKKIKILPLKKNNRFCSRKCVSLMAARKGGKISAAKRVKRSKNEIRYAQ